MEIVMSEEEKTHLKAICEGLDIEKNPFSTLKKAHNLYIRVRNRINKDSRIKANSKYYKNNSIKHNSLSIFS